MSLKEGKGKSRRTVVVVNSRKVNRNKLSRCCRAVIVVAEQADRRRRRRPALQTKMETCGARSCEWNFLLHFVCWDVELAEEPLAFCSYIPVTKQKAHGYSESAAAHILTTAALCSTLLTWMQETLTPTVLTQSGALQCICARSRKTLVVKMQFCLLEFHHLYFIFRDVQR